MARSSFDHPAHLVTGHIPAVRRLLADRGVTFPFMLDLNGLLTEENIIRMSAQLADEARRVRVIPAGAENDPVSPRRAGQAAARVLVSQDAIARARLMSRSGEDDSSDEITPTFLRTLHSSFPVPPELTSRQEVRRAERQWLWDQYEDHRPASPPAADRGFVQHEDFELPPESDSDVESGPAPRPHEGRAERSVTPSYTPAAPDQGQDGSAEEEVEVVAERRHTWFGGSPRTAPNRRYGGLTDAGRRAARDEPHGSALSPAAASPGGSRPSGMLTLNEVRPALERDGVGNLSSRTLPIRFTVDLYASARFPDGPTVANQLVIQSGVPGDHDASRPRCPELRLLQMPPGFATHSILTAPAGPHAHDGAKFLLFVSCGELRNTSMASNYRDFRQMEFVNGQLTEVGRSTTFFNGGYIWPPDTTVVHLDFTNGHFFFGPEERRVTARHILVVLDGMGWSMSSRWDCIFFYGANNDCRWLCRATAAELRSLFPGLPAGPPITVAGVRRLIPDRLTVLEV